MTKVICDKCQGEYGVREIHIGNISHLTPAIRKGKTITDDTGKGKQLHGKPVRIELCLNCRLALGKIILEFVKIDDGQQNLFDKANGAGQVVAEVLDYNH